MLQAKIQLLSDLFLNLQCRFCIQNTQLKNRNGDTQNEREEKYSIEEGLSYI